MCARAISVYVYSEVVISADNALIRCERATLSECLLDGDSDDAAAAASSIIFGAKRESAAVYESVV